MEHTKESGYAPSGAAAKEAEMSEMGAGKGRASGRVHDKNLDNILHEELDNRLPITSSRTAKWYYSAFHNVTAMVGAGVLGLPYAFKYLEWPGGTIVLVLSFVVTLYTLWQLVYLHEFVPGRRFNRYHELGQYAFGPKLGLWLTVPWQLCVMVGLGVTYSVTGGQSLQRFYELVCTSHQIKGGVQVCKPEIRETYWILIFSAPHLLAAQLPNFNALSAISFMGAVMSLSYSTIAFATSLNVGKQPGVQYNLKGHTTADIVFNVFNALGTVCFAYGGHNVVLEIQSSMPSTKEGAPPSRIPMMRGVYFAYVIVAACYFPVAITGYWAFGNMIQDNILKSVGKPIWVVAMANLMVVVHVFASYQLYTHPVFDMIETVMLRKGINNTGIMRITYRTFYVLGTTFLAITFPFFGDLMGLLGALGNAPMTFFMPAIIWIVLIKPKMFSFSWAWNWFIIVTFVGVMIVAFVGSLRNIIVDASTYKFYQ
eukprot:TRINITY_DN4211_c0_g1_i1.p1 TRINITY_DN4211_c0_g1~~TRINITY_DN4211_c0_g1_i1.p1  ORF type:complete len:482 (+),score=113.59 TRINITY_DN4211_c0_g1_i1:374-1819(+)